MKAVALVGGVILAVLLVIQDRGGSDAVEGLMTTVGFLILLPVFLVIALVVWILRR